MDSHGDNVSSDSARAIFESVFVGFDNGACRLAKLLLSDAALRRTLVVDFSDDASFSVGVSTNDCSCVFDAKITVEKKIESNRCQFTKSGQYVI